VERPPHLSLLLPVPLFVIPQRSGGICGCPWGCSYFCLGPPAQSSHSEGRHPERSEGSLCFVLAVASAFTQAPPKSVISTEATHSSIVSSAVERPPHLSLLLPVPLSVIPQRSGGICGCPWGCSYFYPGLPAKAERKESVFAFAGPAVGSLLFGTRPPISTEIFSKSGIFLGPAQEPPNHHIPTTKTPQRHHKKPSKKHPLFPNPPQNTRKHNP
jgi:hypothetical protein